MGRESTNVKYRKKGRKVKRQRKQSKAEDEESSRAKERLIFTYVQEDNFKSSSEFDSRMCTNNNEEPFEQMFVYAALKPDIQLVVMKWYKHDRLLYVYPDFTGSQNLPYFIEVDSDYRHLYSYGIEDVSLKMLSSANEQENFLYLPELPTHWRLEDDLSKKFEMPPKRTQRCAILFTINEISGFEYDNIYIRYHVKLPENIILEEGLLDATTHSVSTSYTTSIHIGLTWQITVLCEEQFDPSQYLFIFFEVISIDSWERERLEGFCHYSLKLLQPCHHTIKLHCIRPVESFLETIHRFFVGGRRKFDYERFVCDHSNHKVSENKSNFHCRYGGRMKNSGQLNLTCQMLTQRNCELLNPCSSRTSGMTLDDIMMAYKEARRRLEAITLN